MKTRREAAWSLLLLGAAELYLAGSGLPTALAQAAGTAFWATEGKEAFGRLGVLQGLAMLLLVGTGLGLDGIYRETGRGGKRAVLRLWAGGMLVLSFGLPPLMGEGWAPFAGYFWLLMSLSLSCWLHALCVQGREGILAFWEAALCGLLLNPAEGLLEGRLYRLWWKALEEGAGWGGRSGRLLLLLAGLLPAFGAVLLACAWLDPIAGAAVDGLAVTLTTALLAALPGDAMFGCLLAAACFYADLLLAGWWYGRFAGLLGKACQERRAQNSEKSGRPAL